MARDPVGPRGRRRKGTRLEKWVAEQLNRVGFVARQQPGSGVYSDFPHDAAFAIGEEGPFIVECKAWKHGWRTGDRALGKADLLVVKRDYQTPLVYMTWEAFVRIAQASPEPIPTLTPLPGDERPGGPLGPRKAIAYDDLGFPVDYPWPSEADDGD